MPQALLDVDTRVWEGATVLGFRDTLLANLIPAVIAAFLAAGYAYLFCAEVLTKRWEETNARRDRDAAAAWDETKARLDRDAAAAAEFYRAYGAFFAAWKSWNDYRTDSETAHTQRDDRIPFLNRVADAEGALESFLIRLTQERNLVQDDLDRLWCFRAGYKQLRYSVRDDQQLRWWRSNTADHSEGARQYLAFKRLSVGVAALLPSPDDPSATKPTADDARKHLVFVTGPLDPEFIKRWTPKLEEGVPPWVSVGDALALPSITPTAKSSASATHEPGAPSGSLTDSLAGSKQDPRVTRRGAGVPSAPMAATSSLSRAAALAGQRSLAWRRS